MYKSDKLWTLFTKTNGIFLFCFFLPELVPELWARQQTLQETGTFHLTKNSGSFEMGWRMVWSRSLKEMFILADTSWEDFDLYVRQKQAGNDVIFKAIKTLIAFYSLASGLIFIC